MESALDVLSRAATMVQDNANEARLSSKELPTTKWRRERRLRAGEYHAAVSATSTSGSPPPPPSAVASSVGSPQHQALALSSAASISTALIMRPLCESTNRSPVSSMAVNAGYHHNMETPLDMSVTSSSIKHSRSSPPPPYREPLPGSTYASALARPSVITQAPSKRGESRDSILISNRENDNGSAESISMCETVIDEHFRRSLGADYVALFGKKSPAPNATPSPQPLQLTQQQPSTPTPPPSAGPYQMQPQALISPKPSTVLLSPSALAQVHQLKHEPLSPIMVSSSGCSGLAPPQQQPLALQRNSAASSPELATTQQQQQLQLQPIAMTIPQKSPPQYPTRRSPPPPLMLHATNNTTSSTDSPPPTASPRSPSTAIQKTAVKISSSAGTIPTLPAIMRIKTEPGLAAAAAAAAAATNTPPASPTSSSNASISTNSDVLASVDDHFAKALGDTWKKLQSKK